MTEKLKALHTHTFLLISRYDSRPSLSALLHILVVQLTSFYNKEDSKLAIQPYYIRTEVINE